MTLSYHASTQWLGQLVMKTHVTWRRWQHSTTPRCKNHRWSCPGEYQNCENEADYALVQIWNQRSQTWQKEGRTTVIVVQRWSHKNVTYKEQNRLVCNRHRSAIDEAKMEYYSGKVQECAEDQRNSSKSLNPSQTIAINAIPDTDILKDLADTFCDFFKVKFHKIRTKLDNQDPEPITIPRVPMKEHLFLSYQPLSEDDVRKLITRSPNEQCSSDPIPTLVLK